jgi:hypothetical protein
MEEEIKKVCIGDTIFLKHVDATASGWLCADGHLNDGVYCSSMSEEFHSGLWEVYIQNQYSSMNEYLEAISVSNELSEGAEHSANTIKDKADKKDQQSEMLHQLEKAAANEQKLNERLFQSKVCDSQPHQ